MLHTLVFSLVLMVVVMLSTVGRRPVRKLLLGLPIGTMLHLVFDGAWATTGPVLVAARRVVVRGHPRCPRRIAAGGGTWCSSSPGWRMVAWIWRRSHLADPAARRAFRRHGRLLS